jgi:D-beta-D-heptose 7-phosphate kinase/D-beta-D-heptose 1-phosphate adenosyltransferase
VIVGLNSDHSVGRLKGPSRPILNQHERRYTLESCKFVDEVFIFDEDTPLELIKRLKPDFIVKGTEYTEQDVIGAEYAKVLLFKPTFNLSTTKILEKILGKDANADS